MKNYNEIIIREIRPDEYSFLDEMLYQAIFVEDKNIVLPRDIIEQPELSQYIENFGQNGDFCLVADENNILVGAVWVRFIQAYGFTDQETPELSMAVCPEYRGRGIGSQLLVAMIDWLKYKGISRLSLSVDKANFARELYKKHGFYDFEVSEKSVIMIKELN